MATRALQQVLVYLAWDTSGNAYKTGDSANHSTSWIKDGTRSATTNATAEVDSTNCPGAYKVTMTATETDCIEGVLCGKSSTANIVLIPTMVAFDYLNTSAPTAAGIPDVNVKNLGGTSQTGRDVGASVLLSSGSGTGQVLLSSGKVSEVVLVDTLTTYTGNTVQTGDAYARLGAPAGASVSADVAALKTDLDAGVTVASVAAGAASIKKNTAFNNFEFLMTDSTNHNPLTTATVTATRSIDGGAFAGCANAVSEVASGIYKINLATTDLNGGCITLRFTATGADDRDITIFTQP